MLCVRPRGPKRRPSHQTAPPVHRGGPVQVLPSGEQDGLARGEEGMGYRQDGAHRRPERDNPQGDGTVDDKVGKLPTNIF